MSEMMAVQVVSEDREPVMMAVETMTEGADGMELAELVVDHWHVGAGTMIWANEVGRACDETGVDIEDAYRFVNAVNKERGHDVRTDVLSSAWVPADRVAEVTELLDRIEGLCVRL